MSDWGQDPLWKTYEEVAPPISIVVAMTHDPMWRQTIESIASQTEADFDCLVVADNATPEFWSYASSVRDKRFRFEMSPKLQGLTRVWNKLLCNVPSETKMIVLMGGENPVPDDYLARAFAALEARPECGYVSASLAGRPHLGVGWIFALTKMCADEAGRLDPAFGPGGIGTILNWRLTIERLGYTPKRIPVEVTHNPYSIMDKVSDWSLIEKKEILELRWGEDAKKYRNAWDLPDFES